MADKELYRLCKKYGRRALRWRQKFAGLLPEVLKRRLYKKKGFNSIYEFAAKLAGMSKEHVARVLNLEKKFEAVPVLKNLLINGEASIHKLARVASIATAQNQNELANLVQQLPQKALEIVVQEAKQNGLQKPKDTAESVRAHNFDNSTVDQPELHLSSEVKTKLLELQQKGIDINALLFEFLEKRELEIAQEKEEISAHLLPAKSRYIPSQIKNLLQKEHGSKCSAPGCGQEAKLFITPIAIP